MIIMVIMVMSILYTYIIKLLWSGFINIHIRFTKPLPKIGHGCFFGYMPDEGINLSRYTKATLLLS